MALLHVKTKGEWKDVDVDRSLFTQGSLDNFICLQELTSYEIVNEGGAKCQKSDKEKKKKGKSNKELNKKEDPKKRKNKKEKVSPLQKDEEGHSDTSPLPKKKRNRKKKKKAKSEDGVGEVKKDVSVKKGGRVVTGQPVDMGLEELQSTSEQAGTKRKAKEHKETPKKKKKKIQKSISPECDDIINEESDTEADNRQKPRKKAPNMSAWDKHFVPEPVLRALGEQGFTSPMPIQTLVLPHAIRDRLDIIGAAETGSGKTLAFGIPLLHHILEAKELQASRRASMEESSMEGDGSDEDSAGSDAEEDDLDEDAPGSEEEDGDESGSDLEEIHEESDEEDDGVESGSDLKEIHEESDEDEAEGDDDDDESDEEDEDDSEDDEDGEVGQKMEDLTAEQMSLGLAVMADEDQSTDGDYDLPPEEEELEDIGDDEFGCVRIENNIDFDWLSKSQKEKKDKKKKKHADSPLYALILAPTRELAIQVKNHIVAAAKYTSIKVATIVGGMAAQKQERMLKKCPEIVVATPGRLWELVQQGSPHLAKVTDIKHLVIDEADRMVEKGHFAELQSLLDLINGDEKKLEQRQTFVFSATLTMVHSGPNRVMKKKKKKMTTELKLESLMGLVGIKAKPKIVDLTEKVGMAGSLTEARIMCPMNEKDLYLYFLLQQYPGRTLVFTNTKDCVRRLVSIFTLLECHPLPLHADMHQRQRLKNLDRFRDNPRSLLLATDVAARGLDIPGVEHVVHYQVPKTTENYVHRSGRTARANKEGLSVMLLCPEELKDYQKILRTLKRDEDLPVFPVEMEYIPGLKERVAAAQKIDKEEHRVAKLKHHNNWFERAAEEAGITLDEDQLLHDLGDSRSQADYRHKIAQWRHGLKMLLKQAIIPRNFSGKYPTKSGKFQMPYMKEGESGGAVTALKKTRKGKTQIALGAGPGKKANKKKYKRRK